jgi:hypothetical protein
MTIHRKITCWVLTGMIGIFFLGVAFGQHQHHQGEATKPAAPTSQPSNQTKNRPSQSVTIEGLKITFEVMSMEEHMKMASMQGAMDHSKRQFLMVTVQDTASKEIMSDAKISFIVIGPAGEKETGKMDWSGDHYAGGFNPKEKGAYQVQLKIESGGMEREVKFTYEAK